jgi:hypothetical protein
MRKRLALTAVGALSLLGLVAAPTQAATFCYDLNVQAGGQSLVQQAGCQDLPPA